MKEMKPRDRFIGALRHEKIDRVPRLFRFKREAKEKSTGKKPKTASYHRFVGRLGSKSQFTLPKAGMGSDMNEHSPVENTCMHWSWS